MGTITNILKLLEYFRNILIMNENERKCLANAFGFEYLCLANPNALAVAII
jgi:hypothetical protein